MGLNQREILPLVFAVIGVILAIVAMIVSWTAAEGSTITPFRIGFYTNEADFVRATAAFLVIGFLAILAAAILILLFGLVDRLRTRTIWLAIIVLSAAAGLCLLLSFSIWLGCLMDAGAKIEMFGAGLWIDLVSGLVSIVTAILTYVFIRE